MKQILLLINFWLFACSSSHPFGRACMLKGKSDSIKFFPTNPNDNDDEKILKARMKYIYDWEDRNNKLYDEASKSNNKGIMDSLDQIDFTILKEKRKVTAEFVKDFPHSPTSAIAIADNYGYYAEADEVQPVYDLLDDKIKNSEKGIEIKKLIEVYKSVAIGMQAPEIIQASVDGKTIQLSSLRGKYVLVDFWASWCGPCRRENPNVVKTYHDFKNKNFEILGVSYDSKKDQWENAIKNDNLTWYQVSDLKGWKNASSDVYGIRAIPSNFLLDKDGRIIAKNIFGDKLEQKLSEVINNK